MSKRKIVRTPAKIEPEMKKDLIELNRQLVGMNVKLKENTNKMVNEIGRCLDEIFIRLANLEKCCGIEYSQVKAESQTSVEQTSEMATATDSTVTPSSSVQPSPEEVLNACSGA